jgi:Tol biopolymer transport system component/imidazolonepropionase-like amidohydrolase
MTPFDKATKNLLIVTTLLLFAITLVESTPAQQESSDSTKAKKWDVANPGLPSDTLEFEANEGTWISVDISPNGQQLVFDLLGDIYTMPITGGNATLLTGGLPYEIQPRFSPDGRKILFTSDRAGGDNIWIMNSDGSNPTQISKEDYRLLNNGAWHPNGQFVVARKHFTSTRSMGAGEMWMYRIPEGGAGIKLTSRKNDQEDAGEPCFSPDGKFLYWSEDMTPGGSFLYNKDPNGTIYVIRRLDMNSGEITDLVSLNGGAIRPQISPDGKTLAFICRARTKTILSLYNLDDGSVRHIWDGLDEDQQETWAIFGVFPGYCWTPDGKAIIISAKGKIWKVDITSGNQTHIPFTCKVKQTVAQALRFPQKVGHETFPVKVIRWPQVTPDNQFVIFQALGYLYKFDEASKQHSRITQQTDHFEFAPTLSSDGKSIVYVTWNDTTGGKIRITSIDGKTDRVLVNRPGQYVSASFSLDGKWIVYNRGTGDRFRGRLWQEDQGIYVIDAEGKTAPKFITREGSAPRFNKNGDRIYLISNEGDKAALVSVNLLGSDRRVLATSERAGDFRLSPDEKWLAFEELWQTYVCPFLPMATPLEIAPEMQNVPVKQLSTDAGTYMSWSPDSKTVRWSLGAELFSSDVDPLFLADTLTQKEKPPKVVQAKPNVTSLGWQEPADIPKTDLYFVGAQILPMNDMSVIPNGVVHVKGNRIVEVGAKDKVIVPANAKVIDVTGKTLMPGLIDIHAHPGSSNNSIYSQQNWGCLANLAFGVTTMHDPSNNSEMIFANAELANQGLLLAPRIFSTGTILYGAEGNFKTVINKYEDAVSAVKRTAAWGAISVKSYNQPRREQRQMIIKAARELGIMVVPEGASSLHMMMTMLLDGHTTLEHPIPVTPLYDPELRLLSRFGSGYTPTLIVGYGGLWGENYWFQHSDVWKNERLSHFTPRSTLDPRSIRRTMAPDEEYHFFALSKTATEILHRGGNVELGAHGQLQGLGAHWELWMLQQGGMTNHEALRCATWMGARSIGLDGELGSIQNGLLADLIVIDGDPLKDIRKSENILYTMINGRLYNAMTLDQIEPVPVKLPKSPNLDGLLGKDVTHSCIEGSQK